MWGGEVGKNMGLCSQRGEPKQINFFSYLLLHYKTLQGRKNSTCEVEYQLLRISSQEACHMLFRLASPCDWKSQFLKILLFHIYICMYVHTCLYIIYYNIFIYMKLRNIFYFILLYYLTFRWHDSMRKKWNTGEVALIFVSCLCYLIEWIKTWLFLPKKKKQNKNKN